MEAGCEVKAGKDGGATSRDAGAGRVDGTIPVRDAGEAFGEEVDEGAHAAGQVAGAGIDGVGVPIRAAMVADPADYRWSSYRANALGASGAVLSPHPLYLALGADEEARRAAYRELFRGALEEKPLSDLRLALNQDQPIGNDRVYRDIEAMTGQRRELRRRGRPRKRDEEASAGDARQGELPL